MSLFSNFGFAGIIIASFGGLLKYMKKKYKDHNLEKLFEKKILEIKHEYISSLKSQIEKDKETFRIQHKRIQHNNRFHLQHRKLPKSPRKKNKIIHT